MQYSHQTSPETWRSWYVEVGSASQCWVLCYPVHALLLLGEPRSYERTTVMHSPPRSNVEGECMQ